MALFFMPKPVQRSLHEFAPFHDDDFWRNHEYRDGKTDELRILSRWIARYAPLRKVGHAYPTNRDESSRPVSHLRKISMLYPTEARAPFEIGASYPSHSESANHIWRRTSSRPWCDCASIAETVLKIYTALLGPTQEYFDMELLPLQDRHAVVAHAYDPGADPGESHVDVLPTVVCYTGGDAGELYIANDRRAMGKEVIMSDSIVVKRLAETVLLFDGRVSPHVVGGVPLDALECQTSLALTYLPADPREIPDFDHPRIPKHPDESVWPLAA